MAEEMTKEVLLRLKSLEDKVGTISAAPKSEVSTLTEAEVNAYHKVATALWEDGTCGINETSPCVFTCNVVNKGKVVPIPKPCIRECTCGPCACDLYGLAASMSYRFRSLGR
jgi:hypothetical protein